ncbi:MAG: hypothetical protein AMXMBFR64_48290 [Myxococcales bacterium]
MARTVLVLAALLAACEGAGEGPDGSSGTPGADVTDAGGSPGSDAPGSDAAADAASGGPADGLTESDGSTEADAAPGGSDVASADTSQDDTADAPRSGPPKPRPYSGAHGCPTLVQGKNTIQSAKKSRSFLLYLPDEPEGAPLLTLWHPAGGSASYMASAFGAQKLAKAHNLIVAVPDSCCGLVEWRFRDTEDPEADLTLFDDLVACTDEQFNIDRERIYTGGFSAGGLWSSFLVIHRADTLAAAVIFSGGVDGLIAWQTPARPVPTLLAWGGPTDVLYGVFSFDQQMKALSAHLQDEGAFVVECDHGGGHTVPSGATNWAVPFALAHRWGQPSPVATGGLDASWPKYCSIPE